jgi:micrococcal nuclease
MYLLLVLLLLSPLPVQAEIFQWKDNYGKTHFSDLPHQGAKILHVDAGHSYYSVKKVYDGDTVLLSNGNKIRFLGINTPEVEGRHKSAQAGGEDAKRWLLKVLKNKRIRLERDVEKKDKYKRLLAHIFTEDNLHINLELIKRGFGTVSIYPPNLKYTDILIKAQQHAEQDKLGIWQRTEYARKPANQLNRSNYKGWQRIVGEVKNIHHTKKNSYLKFSESFSLKVSKKYIALFPDLKNFKNKKIEVRGWITKQKNKFTLFVRHPSQIVEM